MFKEISEELFDFIYSSPTACHTVQSAKNMLDECGFTELYETDIWDLKPGGKYYTTRSMTSIAAFIYPHEDYRSFSVVAPHGDSPCFRIKECPEIHVGDKYTKLNTEVYGGMALNLWLDRPLSAAGRIVVKTSSGVKAILVDMQRDLFVIPSLAIHMNREVNSGVKSNAQIDTLPLFGNGKSDFLQLVADKAGVEKSDIISHDMYIYNRQSGTFYGENDEFIACPKLDDLQCAFSALKAITQADNQDNVSVCVIFDNEEIGSMTKQGANSSFLGDVINRIAYAAGKSGEEHRASIAGGFIISADNSHAYHPLYPEKNDPTNKCYLNGGVVVKNSVKYATDAVSSGIFKKICENAGVPVQTYYNRSDSVGGSTLGNILNTHVSMNTVDIGCAQLSMHSPFETGGVKDTKYMIDAMTEFYNSNIIFNEGEFEIISSGEYIEYEENESEDMWQDISSYN